MCISENSVTPPCGLESEMIWYPCRFDMLPDFQSQFVSSTYMVHRGMWIDPKCYIIFPDQRIGLPDPAHIYGYNMHTHSIMLFITPGWHNACWNRSPLIELISGLKYSVDKIISNKHFDLFTVTSSDLVEVCRIEFIEPINVYKIAVHISLDGGGTAISNARVQLEGSEDGVNWYVFQGTDGCPATVDHRVLGYYKYVNGVYRPKDTPYKVKYLRIRAHSDGTNTMNLRIHIITAWVKRSEYSNIIPPDPWHNCRHTLCW